MIRPDGKEDLKLIDFGMARVLEKGKTVKVACGTPEFVGKLTSCFKKIVNIAKELSLGHN